MAGPDHLDELENEPPRARQERQTTKSEEAANGNGVDGVGAHVGEGTFLFFFLLRSRNTKFLPRYPLAFCPLLRVAGQSIFETLSHKVARASPTIQQHTIASSHHPNPTLVHSTRPSGQEQSKSPHKL